MFRYYYLFVRKYCAVTRRLYLVERKMQMLRKGESTGSQFSKIFDHKYSHVRKLPKLSGQFSNINTRLWKMMW